MEDMNALDNGLTLTMIGLIAVAGIVGAFLGTALGRIHDAWERRNVNHFYEPTNGDVEEDVLDRK